MSVVVQTSGVVEKFDGLVGKVASSRVLFTAVTGTQAQIGERVWDRGLTTDGQPIGYVEDYEVWAYQPPAPRKVSGRGKPDAQGRTKAIKGGYYPTWLGFKGAMGRRETPLDLTSRYRKGYLSAAALKEEDGGLVCTLSLEGDNVGKWHGLTNQKGEHLKLSPQERIDHTERITDIWNEELKR